MPNKAIPSTMTRRKEAPRSPARFPIFRFTRTSLITDRPLAGTAEGHTEWNDQRQYRRERKRDFHSYPRACVVRAVHIHRFGAAVVNRNVSCRKSRRTGDLLHHRLDIVS